MIKSPLTFQQKDSGMMARVMQGIAEMASLHRIFLKKIEGFDAKMEDIKAIGAQTQAEARAVEARLAQISIIEGPKGEKGDSIEGKPGKSAVIDYPYLITEVLNKIPTPVDGLDAEIDPDKLVESLYSYIQKKGLKMGHIDGLEQTISAFSNQLMNKGGYIHGGGDTVSAGSGVSIAVVNGTKVISASGSSGTNVRDEVPSGSGTAFTLAHSPQANTLQLFRGGARQSVANGDYTIVGTAITLSVTLAVGETLTADYSY